MNLVKEIKAEMYYGATFEQAKSIVMERLHSILNKAESTSISAEIESDMVNLSMIHSV